MKILIADKETLDNYMQINGDLAYDSIKLELQKADQLLLLDRLFGIGQEFYDKLVNLETPEGHHKHVLDLLRIATADYAYAIWARMHAVNNSNSGVSVTRTENSAPVSDAKLEAIIIEKKHSAFRFLELALQYLEDNADVFVTWKNSTAYTVRKELLIASVDEFDRYCFIDRSRVTFMKLRHLILQGEEELIKPELGEDLYTLVKAEYQADNLTTANLKIVKYAQRVLANYACGHYKKEEYLLKTAEKHHKAMIDFLRKNQANYSLLPTSQTNGRAPFPNDPESSQFVF